MTTTNRISGMFSGLDTETMVKKLISAERIKVDRVQMERTRTEWKRDAYRDVSSLLSGLQSEYFDFLKPSKNLRSQALYNANSATATAAGTTSTAVSVKATGDATVSQIKINSVTQLATKDAYTSNSRIKEILGTVDFTDDPAAKMAAVNAALGAGNNAFDVTMNGTKKTIELDANYADSAALIADLQTKLNTAFGTNGGVPKLTASFSAGFLKIDGPGHEVTVTKKEDDILTALGIADGATNTVSSTTTLAAAFGVVDGDMDFTINGVSNFDIKSTDTIAQMISKVNNASAGVTLSYSAVSGKFDMVAKSEGFANAIAMTDTDGFLANKLKLTDHTVAQDAVLSIDGIATSRSSNTFTVAGVELTLKGTHAAGTDIEINIKKDATAIVDIVKGFVEKYNDILEQVNKKSGEKRNYNYDPLTTEQKKDLSEDEVKLWEDKAKAGLLRSDATLQKIASEMRLALSDAVSGLGISLRDIGITTSANYKDNGKLILDESTLKTAFETKSEEVISLFTNESATKYNNVTADRKTRYQENGIVSRLYDILQDNIRITRGTDGRKGQLIEMAGNAGDKSDFSSELSRKMLDYDVRISEMLETLGDKEDAYYAQFTRLETAMSKYSAQSGYISQQFGGGA